VKQHTDDTYNGWSNRETWVMNLWIQNDPGLYSIYVDILNRHDNVHELADDLKECFQTWVYDLLNDGNLSEEARGMVLDIGSMWRVNWLEIAALDFASQEEV
jgi:hypothetical protein